MRRDHDRFLDLGARFVSVGPEAPSAAAAFARDEQTPYPVYADPDGRAYAAFGLPEGGLNALLGPVVMAAHLRGLVGGARPNRVTGNVRLLPGSFVIDHGGVVRYAKIGRHAGDIADNEELLAAAGIP
ncbi:MAG: hypothetical protein AVDCRST_MAG73-2233 [uncultured Thermomicrobiales bacterium]|uniref:Redoxin domain-containing protein n=1 Tax=uncultured Thermomicrobiales bacterium TaxID=1645740 RepID=A0A6J4U9M2_9BACT|nr:MAG: hypothetical protein AVDCRST_MAG73-2233 [uncultured Thermomicrobiales bacterium]